MTTQTVKEKPILFSAPMVRAILDGRKTQTRRVVKLTDPSQTYACHDDDGWPVSVNEYGEWRRDPCRYGCIGDRLWVRETFSSYGVPTAYIRYRADGNEPMRGRWKPSIHMPRWASRITLEITDVCVERLLDIRAAGVVAEGFPFSSDLDQFKLLWNQLNARRGFGWDANPWVWVLSFRRIAP